MKHNGPIYEGTVARLPHEYVMVKLRPDLKMKLNIHNIEYIPILNIHLELNNVAPCLFTP